MLQISTIKVNGESYFLPPVETQYYKEPAVLKTPAKGDWYIYFNVWDFESGKWQPVKFYSNFNTKESLALKPKARLAMAGVELEEANEDLKKNINPKSAKPIAPFDTRTYANALADSKDDSPVPRVAEAVEKFLLEKSGKVGKGEAAENKENTAVTYGYFFNRFVKWCKEEKIDHLKLDKIQRYQVHQFLESFFVSGKWVAQTYNNNLGFIKSFFNHYAKIYDYKNVIENLEDKEITEDSDRFTPFSEEQFQQILSYLDNEQIIQYPHYSRTMKPDPFLATIARTIFYTFLRPSEIARIKIKHVKRYKENFFDLGIDITKNKKSVFNELYIEPYMVELYSKLGWDKFFNDKKYEDYYVFTADLVPSLSKSGKYNYSKKFSRLIDKLAYDVERDASGKIKKDKNGKDVKTVKKEWDDNYSLYSIKHTGNIIAFKSGFSLTQLQLQNRHSSVQQTENYLRKLKQEINEEPRPLRPAF